MSRNVSMKDCVSLCFFVVCKTCISCPYFSKLYSIIDNVGILLTKQREYLKLINSDLGFIIRVIGAGVVCVE